MAGSMKLKLGRGLRTPAIDDGEFDPGSERTRHGNSTWKHVVIPDTTAGTQVLAGKGATAPAGDEPAAH